MPPRTYSRRWIKLWCENLLFGTTTKELEPAERWVFVAYLALAGHSPEPGKLCVAPGIPYTAEQRAQIVNVDLATLHSAEEKMIEHGKISMNSNTIEIVNFQAYQTFDKEAYQQAYMPGYMRARRAEKKRGDEDAATTSVTSKLASNYEKEIGVISPTIGGEMTAFAASFLDRKAPIEWIDEAFAEAASHNKRSWAYVKAILNRWIDHGKGSGKKGKASSRELPKVYTESPDYDD